MLFQICIYAYMKEIQNKIMIILSVRIVNNRYNNDYRCKIRRRREECEKKIECENKSEKM